MVYGVGAVGVAHSRLKGRCLRGECRIHAHKTRPFVVDMLELDGRFSLSKVIVCGAFWGGKPTLLLRPGRRHCPTSLTLLALSRGSKVMVYGGML